MTDFKIVRIGNQPPSSWSFKDKRTQADIPMETYKVMVDGEEDPIDVSRKPGNPPHVGDILSGTLETTDFGKKFKAAPRAGFTNFTPKDQAEIKAEWAIGQAAMLEKKPDGKYMLTNIEMTATSLFAMVDRIKVATTNTDKSTSEPAKPDAGSAKEVRDNISKTFNNGEPLPDEPINLDEIDF